MLKMLKGDEGDSRHRAELQRCSVSFEPPLHSSPSAADAAGRMSVIDELRFCFFQSLSF